MGLAGFANPMALAQWAGGCLRVSGALREECGLGVEQGGSLLLKILKMQYRATF